MPTLMPTDTRNALGTNAESSDSRSLLLDRFVYDHPAMNEARKLHFSQVCGNSFRNIAAIRDAWSKIANDPKSKPKERDQAKAFLADTAGLGKRKSVVGPACSQHVIQARVEFLSEFASCEQLFGQLQARLMVNMAGGVMENAGLCLDRFGIPYIPGSAVKGCARRTALAALHEWCAAGGDPVHKPASQANPLAACCSPFNAPAEMLVAIARTFGWCELDWSDRPDQSDFRWACAGNPDILADAAESLATNFRWPIEDHHRNQPWRSLPNFAGSVSFLPAYPVQSPNPDLELDVVTCHHREYYNGNPAYRTAPDTEEPNPVVFPAVAPGHVFVFAVVPLRHCDDVLLAQAKAWLKTGLETFGIGAKTNAGYGWFNCSDAVQQAAITALVEAEKRRQQEIKRHAEEEKRKAEEEAQRRKAEEQKKLVATMTPEQKADYELAQLTEAQFRGRLDDFTKRDPEEQKAIVRALRLSPDQPGSRRKFWDELKSKAQKGGKPAQIEQAIRQFSKQMYPGKEGKMP